MFVEAIERVSKFTFAIYGISRSLGSEEIIPNASTFFFINNEGYALLCKHSLPALLNYKESFSDYEAYKKEVSKLPQHGKKRNECIKKLNEVFQYNECPTIQLDLNFGNLTFEQINIIAEHPRCDLAIIKFEGLKNFTCKEFPVFTSDPNSIKPGKMLCRSGYAFPLFNNYRYNKETDRIEWTSTGNCTSPLFNVEGMIARTFGPHLILSTPGYDFMSGAPLFDATGNICGMQNGVTTNCYTNFDCDNVKIWHKGISKTVTQYPFAYFAVCIDVNIIKAFLRNHHIQFKEA